MFNSKEHRRRQIDTLKIFNDKLVSCLLFHLISFYYLFLFASSVSVIQNDEKYGIKFKSGQNDVTLIIELEPDFPFTTPTLTLEPILAHKWVENNGEIKNFPGLMNFTINSDLGRVCQAIIREFEKKPPLVSSPSVPVQSNFPELDGLDPRQLLHLLNDENYLDDFVEELSPIKALNAELDVLVEETENLARENLEKNDILSDLRSKVESLSIEFLNHGAQYSQINTKYEDKASEYSPQNIRQLLDIGVSDAETECEKTVDAFLEGHQSLNDFLDDFLKVKRLIATRKFKEERLNFQLNQMKL